MTRIKEEFIHEIEIEKSRFICYLNRAFSESEAREYILSIKKLHPNATFDAVGVPRKLVEQTKPNVLYEARKTFVK